MQPFPQQPETGKIFLHIEKVSTSQNVLHQDMQFPKEPPYLFFLLLLLFSILSFLFLQKSDLEVGLINGDNKKCLRFGGREREKKKWQAIRPYDKRNPNPLRCEEAVRIFESTKRVNKALQKLQNKNKKHKKM